jgi:hypothetical protein
MAALSVSGDWEIEINQVAKRNRAKMAAAVPANRTPHCQMLDRAGRLTFVAISGHKFVSAGI